MTPSFTPLPLVHGALADMRTDPFPTMVHAWHAETLQLEAGGTHFGIVHEGPAILRSESGLFHLTAGMYFAVPGWLTIGTGCGMIVTREMHSGFFHLGGPIESMGRLRYIDGCTDSLLVPPILLGDPCLNLLHLPPGTHQTSHRHPSIRVGLVIRGTGWCETPAGRIRLTPRVAFIIHAEALHCFHTDESDLLVIAYHPDSDFGPTHADHPMINRTLISEAAT